MIEDIELLELAQSGDDVAMEALLAKYKGVVATIGRKYFLLGADKEDLLQEGMIGLFKAIRSYDETKNATFSTYASRLIEREMISAIRRANSMNSQILTGAVDIDSSTVALESSPEADYLDQENVAALMQEINKHLSGLEKIVVTEYLKGYNYIDIARTLGKEPKSIDNALTRIKKKLKYLKDRL